MLERFITLIVIFNLCDLNEGIAIVYNRSQWNAAKAKSFPKLKARNNVYVHRIGESCVDLESCGPLIKNLQKEHMENNKWTDIGCNFLFDENGNIYVGRSWNRQTEMVPKSVRADSMSICIMSKILDMSDLHIQFAFRLLTEIGFQRKLMKRSYNLRFIGF